MRKLFWLILLLGGYLWILTSGHDHYVLEKSKEAYEFVVQWISNADADFHVAKPEKQKKKHSRWD